MTAGATGAAAAAAVPPPPPFSLLELGFNAVVFAEVEAAVQQQGAHIGLDVGLRTRGAAGELAHECGEVKRG